jgi:hypothetical protein
MYFKLKSMKKSRIVYIALFCINSSLFAQINIFKQTNKTLKDSIEKKYFINGAERYGYTSHQWQIYLDSAIAITPDNALLWQRKAMPYFKARKYEVGCNILIMRYCWMPMSGWITGHL